MSVARPISNGTKTIECAMRLTGASRLKNDPILLANLFPPSKANLSAQAPPWPCALKEATGEAHLSTLPSSPTVSLFFCDNALLSPNHTFGLHRRVGIVDCRSGQVHKFSVVMAPCERGSQAWSKLSGHFTHSALSGRNSP